jgi:hypothetical protein
LSETLISALCMRGAIQGSNGPIVLKKRCFQPQTLDRRVTDA